MLKIVFNTSLLRMAAVWTLGASSLIGCAALNTKQGQWIFNPTERTWGDTTAVASRMQEAYIEFASEVTGKPAKLHALISPASSNETASNAANETSKETVNASAPVLLYLHGARWNVSGSAYRIQRMQELGFTVIAPDYRGFGKTSRETPSEKMAFEDAMATWKWIAEKYPNQPRYIFGHSLGGAIAIDLASKVTDEAGTMVEGTFSSIPDVVASMPWGWLPVSMLITQRFDSASKVAHIGSPLLVVHGALDGTIAPKLGRKLFDAAVEPKRFVMVDGGSHHNTNSVGQGAYRAALAELFGLPRATSSTTLLLSRTQPPQPTQNQAAL